MRTAGAAAILFGACLATAGPPVLFHLRPAPMGISAAAYTAIGLVAASFVVMFAGVFLIQPPRRRRTLVALGFSLAATVICSLMAALYTVLVGVILALAGVSGYSVL